MTEEQYKKFLEDAEVAEALYKLATEGFNYVETKELKDDSGKVFQIETITRHVPPSVDAQIFWLTNRQPDKWPGEDEAIAQRFGKVQDQLDEYFQHNPH